MVTEWLIHPRAEARVWIQALGGLSDDHFIQKKIAPQHGLRGDPHLDVETAQNGKSAS